MLYGDALFGLATLGLWIFALIDVITTDSSLCRNLEKSWWIIIVLIFPLVGSIIWLLAGRPTADGTLKANMRSRGSRVTPSRGIAPDDDREFLADVAKTNRDDRELLRKWEDDLKRRESALRPEQTPEPGPESGS